MVRNDENTNLKITYTITEACSATGIGRTSIYELINNGSLKSFKAAGRRLIRKTDLEAFFNTCCHEQGSTNSKVSEQSPIVKPHTRKVSVAPQDTGAVTHDH